MGMYESKISRFNMGNGWYGLTFNIYNPNGEDLICLITPVVRGRATKERLCWDVMLNGSRLPIYDSRYGPDSALAIAISTIEDFAINVELGYEELDVEIIEKNMEEQINRSKELSETLVQHELDRLHKWQERTKNKNEDNKC